MRLEPKDSAMLEGGTEFSLSNHVPSSKSMFGDKWNGAADEGATTNRVRFIKLLRRRGETFGFHLRGGREHGTGFFISHVEPSSEAHQQGLRVK